MNAHPTRDLNHGCAIVPRMSRYIRPRIPGASIFFTVALADRRSDLLTREICALRDAVRKTRFERPFGNDAWVVLPDHMHCVWQLPEGDSDYATRWSVIKARFSRAMPHTPRRASHAERGEHGCAMNAHLTRTCTRTHRAA